MTEPEPPTVEEAVGDAHRRGWARVLAATVHVTRDLDLAEECVQEAYAAALQAWPRDGVPTNPIGWLTTAARRRAVDAVRREHVLRSKLPLLVERDELGTEELGAEALASSALRAADALADHVPDERLRLIFLCCHPALAQDAQLALTLRLVCGISTADIARSLLVTETAMSARLTRAKKKIAVARIPYRVPADAELPDRLRSVLGVVHLLFTVGHTAPSGPALLRRDLMDEAIALARMLRELMPDEAEVRGLLALLLVTHARHRTRVDDRGRLVRLADQDRSLWDRDAIAEAHELVVAGLRAAPAGRYVLQAAIASLHAEAPTFEETDWPQVVRLYDHLLQVWPSPVVALNRAVALAEVSGPEQALAEVEALEADGALVAYHYLHAVKADLMRRQGRTEGAAAAYRRALELAGNEAEKAHLAEMAASLR